MFGEVALIGALKHWPETASREITPRFPQADLDEAAPRQQAHSTGCRFVRTIASAVTRKYDKGDA